MRFDVLLRSLAVVAAVPAVGACSSDGSPDDQNTATVGAEGIVGDWFICEQGDCARIDNNATRFRADGIVVALGTGGDALVTMDPVCVYVVGEVGTYTFDGSTLTMTVEGETEAFEANLRSDRLTMMNVPVSVSHGDPPPPEDIEMIRLPSFEGACEDPDNGPAPSAERIDIGLDGGM